MRRKERRYFKANQAYTSSLHGFCSWICKLHIIKCSYACTMLHISPSNQYVVRSGHIITLFRNIDFIFPITDKATGGIITNQFIRWWELVVSRRPPKLVFFWVQVYWTWKIFWLFRNIQYFLIPIPIWYLDLVFFQKSWCFGLRYSQYGPLIPKEYNE